MSTEEKIWVLRDAVTGEPLESQETQPEFFDMPVLVNGRECYWALEGDGGPPYDAATRTGMYDYDW